MSVAALSPVRVLIADDQTLFRLGLAQLLQADPRVEVVGQASDGAEAVELAAALKPDVVLMDVRMHDSDGIEATARIAAAQPAVRVMMLTTFEVDRYILQALRAGAKGYVLKDSDPDAIISSILTVHSGERVMAAGVAERVLSIITDGAPNADYYDGLTGREMEVLRLIAAGKPNKQIAFALKISEKTVRNHVSNMYEKLHIYDRSQAVLYAVRKGLIEP
jgi:DNA-binding NarL/FixJ family response regulator